MTLDNTTTVPKIVAAALLNSLQGNRVYSARVNNAYRSLLRNAGNEVIVNTNASATVSDYTAGATLSYASADVGTAVTISLNEAFSWSVSIDDMNAAKSLPNVLAAAVAEAGQALADKVDVHVRERMLKNSTQLSGTALNHSVSGGPTLGALKFTEAARLMDVAKVPSDGRWCIIGPYTAEWISRSISSQNVILANTARDAMIGSRNGDMGFNFAGFKMYKSNNAKGRVNRTGSALSAITSGPDENRRPTLADNQAFEEVVFGVDSATGFVEQIRRTEALRLPTTFADAVRGLYTFGIAILDAKRIYAKEYKFSGVPE